ncbi:nucleoside-specific channel-forming Tsx family protein [Shewanella xiamenensis]|uniref:nucleoside-specific channel-forming Tsx family protein n=1 Tax=Shewanella TaxID=22 RepID=UPI001669181A|nr:outer membrane protein OmpK [Shewanella xiamenensis]MCL1070102.1 outer membrane protein OmpK [Shewanella xiamenensis]MCR4533429.1 outer membrane protein OmpK [Shewanella xiamenensis]MDI5849625.1 outer membrane protein OmpK [Shewanella xiamenensis]WHF57613.1 outer membrane protein OmpK [Shewanella xiamenensis]GGM85982.1 membrane protein [Shewanella xiamenensis]
MKNVKTLALAATAVAAISGNAFAADRSDIYATDYKWMQFNAMYAVNELPRGDADDGGHDYLEMEFGGRKGIVDLYGYVDVFNLANSSSGDKTGGDSKMFMKFAPRFSLDAITGKDLSFGPVQEVYFSTLFNWGGGAFNKDGSGDVNMSFWGVGADVMVPWLGKTGMNLYATYDINAKDWNGYQFSMNWFKPFYFFDNKSFISFQGYVDYQFGADEVNAYDDNGQFINTTFTSHGGAAYFGLHWHSDNYALGYGLKAYSDVYLLKDEGTFGLETKGFAHYFTATYKF